MSDSNITVNNNPMVNFDLEVTDFAVENVAELLQSDLPITGRLDLDAHV